MVPLSEVEPQPVEWLWEPYVARGKLTILAGEPGAGKGWIAMSIATSVSRGASLPNPYEGLPKSLEIGTVLYFSTEDGLADTIRPRMDGMGADVGQIFVSDQPLTLDDSGFEELRQFALQKEPDLIVIDPLQSFMGGKLDMHRANETRPFLHRLKALAEEVGCAIVVLCHISKSAGSRRAVFSVLGSIDIAGAARSILLVGQDDEASNPNEMRLAGGIVHVKSNIGPIGPAIGFCVDRGQFGWTGRCEMTEHDILGGGPKGSESTPIQEAVDFLNQALSGGSTPANTVLKDAKAQGIADRTLNRAKRKLGVVSRKFEKGTAGYPGWEWRLAPVLEDEPPRLPSSPIYESGNLVAIQVQGSETALETGNLDLEEVA